MSEFRPPRLKKKLATQGLEANNFLRLVLLMDMNYFFTFICIWISDSVCIAMTWNEITALACNFIKKEKPATLLKKKLWHRCFPVNSAKIRRTPFL